MIALDRPRTPDGERAWVEVPLGAAPADVADLVAALAVGLARFAAIERVELSVCRRAGEHALTIEVAPEASLGAVRAAVRDQLVGPTRPGAAQVAVVLDGPPSDAADLSLRLGAAVTWRYDAAVLDASTVARLAEAVDAVSGAADATAVACAPLLGPIGAAAVIRAGDGGGPAPPWLPVASQVAAHAAARPHAIAVRHRATQLTYRDLDAAANRLAHVLGRRGLGRGARVMVSLTPHVDIAVALLGILRAGAIYIPLDPAYPAARIEALLADVRPDLVVTHADVAARLPLGTTPRLLLDAPGALGDAPTHAPAIDVDPDQPATVYFTSGTTGRPKGVLAAQRNLVTYLGVSRARYGFSGDDVMPAIARFGFSISLWELLSPLTAGGTLVVLDREVVLDPPRLADALTSVTVFHAGPSLLRGLLPAMRARAGAYAQVRHASSGGDLIAPELLRGLAACCPAAEVFVIYGCSEVSCMGTTYPAPADCGRTFVGRPFTDVAVRVVDDAGQRVPSGVIGEVQFAGGGVVLGYLDRDDLTAEKFVVAEGHRWYRTGDQGRWSRDGWLELLGRTDFQVKVRGMRIELGEVEAHLRRAAGVKDAVAAGWRDAHGDTALTGYVVAQTAPASTAAEREWLAAVRQHLVAYLPDYMVPAHLVALPALPLNHNLKVDRKALPPPTPRTAAVEDARLPRPGAEAALAAIWSELLGAPQVARDDHFFELGGDSLRGVEALARIEAELGAGLTGMDLLRESLAGLAAKVAGTTIADDETPPRHRARAAPRDAPGRPPGALGFGVAYGPARGDLAVLILPPVGPEAARAHFVLTRLQHRLADAGVPSLRLDVPGSGEAAELGPIRELSPWREATCAAAVALRADTGATRLVVVGVRLGACLAAEVPDATRLVLWDPVVDGAAHLASLTAAQRAYERGTQRLRGLRGPPRTPGEVELLGLRLTAAAAEALETWSLPPPTAPLEWIATSDDSAYHRLGGPRRGWGLRSLPAPCAWEDVARLDDTFPDAGVSAALATACVGHALAASTTQGPAAPPDPPARLDGVFHFGSHRHLVGVGTPGDRRSVAGCVLVSAGVTPRVGPFGLYRELALAFAARDVTTLRFDLGGLGDSASVDAHRPLATRTAREVAAAISVLRKDLGADAPLWVGGLCSGAEDALRAAAVDPSVAGAFLIDPAAYPTPGHAWRDTRHRLARRALRALGVYQPFRYAGGRVGASLVDYAYLPQPEMSDLLERITGRGGRVHLLYTGGARATFNHASQVGEMFPRVDRRHLHVTHLPQMEHTQALAADRAALIAAIVDDVLYASQSAGQSR